MKLKVQPLTGGAFELYGQVIAAPKTEATAHLPGMDFWVGVAELPDLGAPYSVSYATQEKRAFIQRSAERHMQTPELLMPIGGDMIVVVGAPDYPEQPERLPSPERFAAFWVKEGQGVIFKPGVWHWAPFAVKEKIMLLVVYTAGTAQNDALVVDLPPEAVLEVEL
jgi:ureidoglycolate hydrolase